MLTRLFSNFIVELQFLLFTAPVILLAIICHECAHGWVSYKLGDPTAKNVGRLTLNPLKHLDSIGTLCMLFFHVGWASPVPINPWYYLNRKRGIIYVSPAEPAANFILAILSLLAEGLLMKLGSNSSMIIWILCQLCYYSVVVYRFGAIQSNTDSAIRRFKNCRRTVKPSSRAIWEISAVLENCLNYQHSCRNTQQTAWNAQSFITEWYMAVRKNYFDAEHLIRSKEL